MRRLTWRGAYIARGGSVPAGYEPYDFALDAIQKALDGTRPWNRETNKTLENYLRATSDSDIKHLVESLDNKTGRRLAPTSGQDETVTVYEIVGTQPDPLRVIVDREWQPRIHAAAIKGLDGDKFLIQLFQCLEGEITAPVDIAVMLNTTVDNVNNEKKRLKRKLEQLDTRVKPSKKRTGP